LGVMAPSPSGPWPSLRFAGLRFTPLGVDAAVAGLAARDPAAPFAAFVTFNAEHAYLRRRDPEFAACGDNAFMGTNDSRVLGRAALLAGLDLDFAPGAYVVKPLVEGVIAADEPITIIGCAPELVDELSGKYGLTAVAHHNPPMGFIRDDAAVAEAVAFVVAHPARFVFVCVGPPQSEKFCQRVIADGRATGLGLCVGSSLSLLTRFSNRAPDFMENAGLVWLYRLAREPRRLFRRYLINDVIGLGLGLIDVAAIRLGRRRPAHG
jgi:N-acetylglucosaminyldiphosphoundecaprenol N-acetyl-beta-D-mannosaminyltransferase